MGNAYLNSAPTSINWRYLWRPVTSRVGSIDAFLILPIRARSVLALPPLSGQTLHQTKIPNSHMYEACSDHMLSVSRCEVKAILEALRNPVHSLRTSRLPKPPKH